MKYTEQILATELEDIIKDGIDIVKISKLAFNIYHNHRQDLPTRLDEILLQLMAMEEGPEFEMSHQEICELIQRLKKK